MQGFFKDSGGYCNVEKALDCKEALEGFSRRCRSFIDEEVRCIPSRAPSPRAVLKDVCLLSAAQES